MPRDLIIFDCDGVLTDSELIACRVDAACLTESGISITAEETERYIGVSAAATLAAVSLVRAYQLVMKAFAFLASTSRSAVSANS